MYKKQLVYILLFIFCSTSFYLAAQQNDTIPEIEIEKNDLIEKEYPFIIVDSPARLFSMRQFNQDYLSTYRYIVQGLDNTFSRKISFLSQCFISIITVPLTHEEGHRSILTNEYIGSISQPFFNKHGAAYVNGVSDQSLQNLRNTKLSTYIRLHTAGLESDYALVLREASLLNYHEENFDILWIEYFLRKFSLASYYFMGLFKYDFDVPEETNELKRDIVGHDIYGTARHLHRPDMVFYRYTKYEDLSSEELKFVKRTAWRSLLNLVDPLLILKNGFNIRNVIKIKFPSLCSIKNEQYGSIFRIKCRFNAFLFSGFTRTFPSPLCRYRGT